MIRNFTYLRVKEISEPIIYTIPKDSSFVVEYARETAQKYGFIYILSIKDNKFIKDWIYKDDFFKEKILEQYIYETGPYIVSFPPTKISDIILDKTDLYLKAEDFQKSDGRRKSKSRKRKISRKRKSRKRSKKY